MCSRLSKLHSAVHPHPFEDTKRIIEEEFKRSFHEIFSVFEEEPIGIGAIAQVCFGCYDPFFDFSPFFLIPFF